MIFDCTNLVLCGHPSPFLDAHSPNENWHAVGWTFSPSDSHVMKQLRVLVLKAASGIEGMTGLVEEGKRQFAMLVTDINSVHPELRDVVMNVAVANGGVEGTCARMPIENQLLSLVCTL